MSSFSLPFLTLMPNQYATDHTIKKVKGTICRIFAVKFPKTTRPMFYFV